MIALQEEAYSGISSGGRSPPLLTLITKLTRSVGEGAQIHMFPRILNPTT